jgi:acetyl esterase/lipase
MQKSFTERLLTFPNHIFSGTNRRDDIAYGDHPSMKYDEFPAVSPDAPLVLFWYGGGWKSGNKNMYRFMGHRLQKMGAHAFVIDYPKYPQRVYPGFTEDSNIVLAQIRNQYPGRPIILMGHSAGGNTALLTGMAADSNIAKIISVAGACTIGERAWYDVFGEALKQGKTDPRNFVDSSPLSTKYLFIHGALDTIVGVTDSITLNRKLKKKNITSQLNIVALAEHILILPLLAFGPLFFTRRKLKRFILE